jgi:hypothetical protein
MDTNEFEQFCTRECVDADTSQHIEFMLAMQIGPMFTFASDDYWKRLEQGCPTIAFRRIESTLVERSFDQLCILKTDLSILIPFLSDRRPSTKQYRRPILFI